MNLAKDKKTAHMRLGVEIKPLTRDDLGDEARYTHPGKNDKCLFC